MASRRGPKTRGPRSARSGRDAGRRPPSQPPESAEFFEALVKNSLDAVAIVNADGQIAYESPAVEGLLGWTPEEHIGASPFDFIHPDDLAKAASLYSELLQSPGATVHEVIRLMHKDGSVRHMEIMGQNLLHKAAVAGIVANLRDITESHEARVRLHQSENRLRSLFERASDGIFAIDLSGVYAEVNQALVEMFGFASREEMIGKNSFEMVDADELERAAADFLRVLESSGVERVRYNALRADGSGFPCEVSASVLRDSAGDATGIIGIIRDVTERERMEASLRRSDEYHRTLLENAMEGVAVVNRDGSLRYASPTATLLRGRNSPVQTGSSIFGHVHADDAVHIARTFDELLHSSGGTARTEVRILHDDGEYRTLEVVAKNLLDDPLVDGIVANFRDITESKKMEEALLLKENAIENSVGAIAMSDMDGTITYVNRSCMRLWGSEDKRELVGKPYWLLLKEDTAIAEIAASMIKTGAWEGELVATRKDGEEVHVQVWASLVKNEAGTPIQTIASFVDVTAQKQAEERLRISEAYHRAITENIHDAVSVLEEDGTVRYDSPSLERVLGYGKDELLGTSSFDFIHPDDADEAAGMFAALLRNPGGSASMEVRAKHKDGSWRTIETTGKNLLHDPAVKGIVTTFTDVTERRQAEEALLESERKYRLHFESVNDVIYSIDRHYIVTSVSPSVQRLLGYDPGELIGKSMFELRVVHPQCVDEAASDVQRVLQGDTIPSAEYYFVAKDGSLRIGEVSGSPLRTREGEITAIVSVARDITERRRMEESLLIKENAIENSINAIAMTDMQGTVTYVNKACMKLWGNENRNDLVGMPFWDLLSVSRVETIENIGRAIAENHCWQGELEGIANDGTARRVLVQTGVVKDDKGNPIQTISSFIDVTEMRRAEEALRESQQHFEALVENLSDAVFHFRDGVVTWCNDRVADIYGYTKQELLGKNATFFMSEDVDYMSFVKEAYASMKQKGYYRGQWTAQTKGGEDVEVEYSISLIPDKYPIELVAVARNVTEQRQMEQQLHQAGRLAAVGELAAGVAHELNNPLAAVQGFAQFLAERSGLDEAVKGDIQTIYREAQRATKITGNLLSFARKYKPEKKLISLNDVLEKSLELHAYRLRVNNVEVDTQLDPNLPATMADFHQMQQVFVNIITNAEQAMTEAHGRGRLVVRTEHTGGVIRVTFADDGPGIPNGVLKSIFDPFFTTKGVGQGTGLGLSICYGIVREHGGHLYAESEHGKGATFVVEIPIVSERRAGAADVCESEGSPTTPHRP